MPISRRSSSLVNNFTASFAILSTSPTSLRNPVSPSSTTSGNPPTREAITVDYTEGGVIGVPQHDGSIIKLRKLSASYDPTDRIGAQDQIAQAAVKGEVLTGLLYLAPDAEDLHAHLNTCAVPFNQLGEKDLCPGAGTLEKINASLR